ncbi:hypothetical protein Patl1_02971 [Pistacia atlantica]|nr:hypothetical protein Patl1_02971 [Pistacia atlantica]
MYLSKY